LEISGGGNHGSAPITIAGDGDGGVGAIHSSGGSNTLSGPITVSGTTVSNSAGATTLTLSGPVNLALVADLEFTGAGDTTVTQSFGNGNSPIVVPNSLAHFGYHINNDGVALDLDQNEGMMGGPPATPPNPFNGPNFYGLSFLTSGPGNRGLDFNDDNDFINTGSIGQVDNYSNLWVGKFTPPQTGDYGLRNAGDDDRAGIWFDLDRDGVFESSTPGLGSNRGEQLSWEDGGWKTVALTGGLEYMVGFTHREGGGGSRADFRVRGPGISGEPIIKPADAGQAGLWKSLAIQPDNNLIKNGAGTVTLNGDNTYNGTTTINGGTLKLTGSILNTDDLIFGGGVLDLDTTGLINVLQSNYSIADANTDITNSLIVGSPTLLVSTFNDGSNDFTQITAIPEPSTLLLAAIGLLGLAFYRRRK